ncbi:MAG: hypothetical protein Kow0047_18600 [Anaerolineae bacterium]
MTQSPSRWQRWQATLRFNLMYLGRPPWDTGITPPELRELIEGGQIPPGRAVDLGCGTGTNAIYLASHGFEVTGVDSAWVAIWKARRKAKRANVRVRFYVSPVTRLSFITEPVDLALDIGCLHGLPEADRPAYAAELARIVRPGGYFLLYAWGDRGWAGIDPPQVQELLAGFSAIWIRTGEEHGLPSSWYLLQRERNA